MYTFFTTNPWGIVLFIVICGHITIMCSSLYLHRAMSHGGLKLHWLATFPMRAWLWATTAITTREWVATHRKHHAFTDQKEDPHSPVNHGVLGILFGGVYYYRKATRMDDNMLEFYSKGCPNDWLEQKVFGGHTWIGPTLLLGVNLLIFGFVAGPLVWLGQILWSPFWAAGVVNGIGHWQGYKNFRIADASRNIFPIGILLSGEELHNNHHKFPSSAKFSQRWFEFDMGWAYIKMLSWIGLAKVLKTYS